MRTCARCRGTYGLIEGDGPILVCRDCVELLGNLVAKPEEASNRLLTNVLELHADVVRLTRNANEPHELAWEWVQ